MTSTMQTVAREDLCRSVSFDLVRADEEGSDDGLTIEGYGAVFNAATRIDSWEGVFDEVIAPGAFRKSLRERTPKMQFDHGRHPMLGSLPLGRWDIAEEDSRGLHVVGRLSDNWLVQPFRDAIRDEGVTGMSFRFSVVREEWRDNAGKLVKPEDVWDLLWAPGDRGPLVRTLKEVKVPEVGPVTWPAYEETSVGVRSKTVTIDLGRLTDPETRATLARAVFLADAANRSTEPEDAPPTNQDPPSEHPAEASAAPLGDRSSPGEHPSAQQTPKGNPAKAFAENARGYLLSMRSLEGLSRDGG